MKIAEGSRRFGSEEPDAVRAIIDSYIKDVSLHSVGESLKGFRWQGERGTIYHWIRLLDRIDEFLTYCTENHIKSLLNPDLEIKDELPVPEVDVISALDCSIEILNHVAGKEHYSSLPQLNDLLACSSPHVLHKTLILLHTMYQRNISGYQSIPSDMANRLQTLAAPTCGPSFLDIAKGDVSVAGRKDKFKFRYIIEPNPSEDVDERTEEEKQSNSTETKTVRRENRSDLPQNDFEALKEIMSECGAVRGRRQRFRLVRNLRAAALYSSSREELELEACNRFLALSVLVPISVLGEIYGRIHETFRKLGADELFKETFAEDSKFSEKVRLYSLYAFTSKFAGMERGSFKMDGVDKILKNGRYSPLGRFLSKRASICKLENDMQIRILEATINMVNTLSSISFLCDDILETGFLESLIPFLEDYTPEFAQITVAFLTTIEILFTNSTSGVDRLNSCKGLEIIQARLTKEIDTFQSRQIAGYEERFLIKKLFKCYTRVIMTSETSGIEEIKVLPLYEAMNKVFVSYSLFGPGVFDVATMCFRQIMHHEPLQYKSMASVGLDVAYLDALQEMVGRDGYISLNIVPTISAICLSEQGKDLVRSKNAIHLIADTFTDPLALCSLPASQAIGRSLEEMIRHHDTMLPDVVEMLVSAVDTVRKIACTREIEVTLGTVIDDTLKYINIAILRLTEILIPVCDSSPSASKAFLDQGGLQIFVDLLQPNASIEYFCCTQASTNIMTLLKVLILSENRQEYVMEVILSELKKSLAQVNNYFADLESHNFSLEQFRSLRDEDLGTLNVLIRLLSKSALLMGALQHSAVSGSVNKPLSLAIDENLCFFPELDEANGKVIQCLTIMDEWRIENDIELKERGSDLGSEDGFKQSDREIESRRDVLNQFFRSSCQIYNALGRLADKNLPVWGDDEAGPQTIALLFASSMIKYLSIWGDQEIPGRRQRLCIRVCRVITAVIFHPSKRIVNYYVANAFVRFGGLDLFLSMVQQIASKSLEESLIESNKDAPFIPTLKEIKEQERQLEITGVGRVPLSKDVDGTEWLKRSFTISTQHSLLSMFGILELITEKNAYKIAGPDHLTFFQIPFWANESPDAKFPDLITSICRRVAVCLAKVSLKEPNAWALNPLPLTKFIKSLATCEKYGRLKEKISEDEMIQPMSGEEKEAFDMLVKEFPGKDKTIVVDIIKHCGVDSAHEMLRLQDKNAQDTRIWMLRKGVPVLPKDFKLLWEGKNLHAAKSKIMPLDAEAYLLSSIDQSSIDIINRAWKLYATNIPGNFVLDSFDRLMGLIKLLPSTVHDFADLLVESFKDKEDLRGVFEHRLSLNIKEMRSALNKDFNGWETGLACKLATLLHLLTSVLNKSESTRKASHALVPLLLQVMESWKKGSTSIRRSDSSSLLKVPKWIDACMLSLGMIFEENFKPANTSVLEKTNPQGSDLKSAFCSKVKLLIPPLGGEDICKFVAASNYAVESLKIALRNADNISKTPSNEEKSPSSYYDPCPKSTVSASLGLLSVTSKTRKVADAILNARGHHLVLSLTPTTHVFECDKMVAGILRHLVEDEASLQASMESVISQNMQKKRRTIAITDVAPHFKMLSIKQFFCTFMHLACRDPDVFCKAVYNTCEFMNVGDKVTVKLLSENRARTSGGMLAPEPSNKQPGGDAAEESQSLDKLNDQKLSTKKSGKKVPSPVSAVIDAIIGRFMQASSSNFSQKVLGMMTERATESDGANQLKVRADWFCVSQQSLCINLLSQLLISFSHCVTAFLRRDADPIPEWVSSKYSNKLNTPKGKHTHKDKSSSKRQKIKGSNSPQSSKVKLGNLNEGSNLCFLIGSIIRNQISYHGSSPIVPVRQALSKDSCSLLIALSQRSTEGQKRICQQIQLILHSFAYPGRGNISNFVPIRTLEKREWKSPSPDVEGSLILLATLLTAYGNPSPNIRDSHHEEVVERLINAGLVTVLVDTLCQLDLSEQNNDRLKILLSAIVRSLEKLTAVRATAKSGNEEEKDLGMNFENLVAHLNESGWHLAGEDELSEDNVMHGDYSSESESHDDLMQTDSDDVDLSTSRSYYTTDSSSYSGSSIQSDDEGWSYGEEDAGNLESDEDPLVVDMYSGDSDEPMEEEESDHISDSEDEEEDDEDDGEIRDYDYDLDDIFPPEEAEFDHEFTLRNPARLIQSWGRGVRAEGPFTGSFYLNRFESQDHDSEEDDIDDPDLFLDGRGEMDDYYSDEEYEDEMPSSFMDDRLVSEHGLANTNVPGFLIQDAEGDRSSSWRGQDPLFGTAFISPRIASSPSSSLRYRIEETVEAPGSIYHHPLLSRNNTLEGLNDSDGRHSRMQPFSSPEEPLSTRISQFRGWVPVEGGGNFVNQIVPLRSEIYQSQNGLNRYTSGTLANRYAVAMDQSMAGRPLEANDAGQRRRDRLELTPSRYLAPGSNIFRTTSPPIIRPRQRQRTELEATEAQVDESGEPATANDDNGGNVVSETPRGGQEDLIDGPSTEDGDIEPIDPEFLAALPPDLQREVLENHERERRARRISRVASLFRRENRNTGQTDSHVSEIVSNIPEELQAEAIMGLDTLFEPNEFGSNDAAEHDVPPDQPPVGVDVTTRNVFESLPGRHPGGQGTAFGTGTRELLGQLGEWTVNIDGRRRRSAGRVRRLDTVGIDFPEDPLSERIPFVGHDRGRLTQRTDSRLDVQSDSEPLLSDDQVPHLLRLLRFSRWDGRLHLNRAIRHLTESKQTARAIFHQIFALLRCPLSSLETEPDALHSTLTQLKHPMPSLLTKMHEYIVENYGSTFVVNCLGLEPPEDEANNSQGILSISVVRRLLELLRHCFSLIKRGVDNVLELEAPCLYDLYKSMGIVSQEVMETGSQPTTVPALDVLLSLPLRHDISKSNLRGISLELVSKFVHHFEKLEIEIREKEHKIREKERLPKNGGKDSEYPSINRLEVERLSTEIESLHELLKGPREAFRKIDSNIVKNYVMMLTYPSLKEAETESVRTILQSLTTMNLEHWHTLANASGEFVRLLSIEATADLKDLANGNVADKVWRPDTKGVGIYRCLQSVAEGVFQLVIDRFDAKSIYLPEEAVQAREIAARSLTEMLEQTKESLWTPFNQAANCIERSLEDRSPGRGNALPLPVQLLRPYVESYFLLHDTLRCSTCSLETLAKEVNELTEEEEAWTNKREEVSKAAQEQATASFTRIQSIDVFSPSQVAESSEAKSPERMSAPCLPSSDTDFMRFAESHRKIVNLIVSYEPSVLEESMNMLLKHAKLLDFENKRIHFRKRVQTLARQLGHHSRLALNVRRAHIFEDSFNQLRVVSKSQLRSPLKVTFSGEEGVDAGGVSREWYQVMSREMFNPAISLFEAIPPDSSTYQPNPNSVVQTDEARGISHLDYFKFVGHVVGKALLDDQIIDAHFTRSFYKHLLGQPLTYRDIEGVDPDFFKNLSWMLENEIDGVLDLTFSEESDFFGQKSVIELCPNGANIKVTDQNKRDYVDAIARHRMTNAIQPQIHAFLEGFWNVVPRISLALFNDHELELMISGLPDVDVLDLRANCEYHGGYSAASQIILWFWEIAISMDREQRALLLQFVTGTSKVPVGGFSELQAISGRQKFQIHKAFGGNDRLPSAHTCFNQLDLPEYNTKEQLREKLLVAIHEGKEGFGFA